MFSKYLSVISLLSLVLSSAASGEIDTTNFDSLDNNEQCYMQVGAENYYIITEESMGSKRVSSACVELGGKLAAVTSSNFNNITSLLIRCKGPGTRAWIKSWQGTDYDSKCLAIFAGHAIPGGGIDISCLGDSIPAICTTKDLSKFQTGNQAKEVQGGFEEEEEDLEDLEDLVSINSEILHLDEPTAIWPFPTTTISVRHARKQSSQSPE